MDDTLIFCDFSSSMGMVAAGEYTGKVAVSWYIKGLPIGQMQRHPAMQFVVDSDDSLMLHETTKLVRRSGERLEQLIAGNWKMLFKTDCPYLACPVTHRCMIEFFRTTFGERRIPIKKLSSAAKLLQQMQSFPDAVALSHSENIPGPSSPLTAWLHQHQYPWQVSYEQGRWAVVQQIKERRVFQVILYADDNSWWPMTTVTDAPLRRQTDHQRHAIHIIDTIRDLCQQGAESGHPLAVHRGSSVRAAERKLALFGKRLDGKRLPPLPSSFEVHEYMSYCQMELGRQQRATQQSEISSQTRRVSPLESAAVQAAVQVAQEEIPEEARRQVAASGRTAVSFPNNDSSI